MCKVDCLYLRNFELILLLQKYLRHLYIHEILVFNLMLIILMYSNVPTLLC